MVKRNKRVAVLLSDKGKGSNLKAIVKAIESKKIRNAEVVVVVSNKRNAKGLFYARKKGIKTEVLDLHDFKIRGETRSDYDKFLGKLLKNKYKVDLVVLAGWMLILSDDFIKYFPNRTLNLHPAILPESGEEYFVLRDGTKIMPVRGKFTDNAVQDAIESKYPYFGSTVHFITSAVDEGPVVLRSIVRVKNNDTKESLYAKMKKKEHVILPSAIALYCADRIKVGKDGKVIIKKI